MRSVVSLRGASTVAARLLLGATLVVAVSIGCSVDDKGLAATSEKLQRDASGAGGLAATGSGGNLASGGNIGSGGSIGDSGTPATGGTTGSGGMIAVGTGGASATGG